MTIKKLENGELIILGTKMEDERKTPYIVTTSENGKSFVTLDSVTDLYFHIMEGNSKTGSHVINFNFSTQHTCNHNCECFKNATCYACNGCYNFSSNQALYSENVKFFINSTDEQILKAWQIVLEKFGFSLWRYFTIGDIPNTRFFKLMVQFAINNPSVKFWSYTKKYNIVNKWIDENGDLPENLRIIFSHWMNENGSYFPMENPHTLPTSEFIPYGREDLLKGITHVCPCSDPSVVATCETCDHPCYDLQKGEKMGLCEHSTKQTKQRDKELKQAKQAIKAGKQ